MDGRTRYNKMIRLLKPLVGEILHLDKIRHKVMIEIGTSENVVRETLKFMIDMNLIIEREHMIFEVIMIEDGK